MRKKRDDAREEDYDEDRPRRRKRRKSAASGGSSRWLLIAGGVLGGLLLVCCGGIGIGLWNWFGAENSPSPVPLKEARAGFQTKVTQPGLIGFQREPAPPAPPPGFQLVRYPSPAGQLAAYVTA